MAEINWNEHTPDEVLRALKTQPRVIGPWVDFNGKSYRVDHDGSRVVIIEQAAIGWSYSIGTANKDGRDWTHCSGLERGKQFVDEALKLAGWLFVE